MSTRLPLPALLSELRSSNRLSDYPGGYPRLYREAMSGRVPTAQRAENGRWTVSRAPSDQDRIAAALRGETVAAVAA